MAVADGIEVSPDTVVVATAVQPFEAVTVTVYVPAAVTDFVAAVPPPLQA